jgi:exopolysaccharide biosynthesis polyprenyl glycosylphosphotransferase
VDAAAAVAATATVTVMVTGRWQGVLVATACILAGFGAIGLYRPRLHASVLDDAARILLATGVAWAVVGWLGPPLPAPAGLPAAPTWWWLPVAAAVMLARSLGHASLRRRRRQRSGTPTVIVGVGAVGIRAAQALLAHPECGLRPIGFVGPCDGGHGDALPLPVLGPVDGLAEVVDRNGAHAVVVTFLDLPDDHLVGSLRDCRQRGSTVFLVPRFFEMDVGWIRAEVVDGVPLVRMRPVGEHRWEWRLKRLVDVVGATVGLVLLAPLLLAVAVAVRREMGRAGVLFRQERVGPNGVRFRMLKFRSITPFSDLESRACWDISNDRRIGPVGRLIRRTSLDELPQLVNVLRGEMSLVGPRPERPFFVEKFGRQHRHYQHRHRVPGGMTGWAQVNGLRGDTSIADRVAHDNYYIENWSLGLDLKIMLRTVVAVLPRRSRRRVPSPPPSQSPSPLPSSPPPSPLPSPSLLPQPRSAP